MKIILRFLMVLLSYAPISTVAVAAQAKANEIEGEMQSAKLGQAVRDARHRLIPPGEVGSTMEDAATRYANLTGLQGEDLQKGMAFDIELLTNSGLIQSNEKLILASGPSEHTF